MESADASWSQRIGGLAYLVQLCLLEHGKTGQALLHSSVNRRNLRKGEVFWGKFHCDVRFEFQRNFVTLLQARLWHGRWSIVPSLRGGAVVAIIGD